MIAVLELSGFHAWPQAGGVDDQSLSFIEDVGRVLALKQAVKDGRVNVGYYEPVSKSVKKVPSPFGRRKR